MLGAAKGNLGTAAIFIIMVIASIAGKTPHWVDSLWSTKALKPKFSKLNPIEGHKATVLVGLLVELGKSVFESHAGGGFTLAILNVRTEPILHLSKSPEPAILNGVKELAGRFSCFPVP